MDIYVYNPAIARKLLKMGYTIIDLKPMKRENGEIDFTRSVFVFKNDNEINKTIDSIIGNKC